MYFGNTLRCVVAPVATLVLVAACAQPVVQPADTSASTPAAAATAPAAGASPSTPAATTPLAPPPLAAPGKTVTVYPGGLKVADPYRALEDLAAPATRQWAQAQGDYTRAWLDRLPGQAALRERVAQLDAADPVKLRSLQFTNTGALFYLRRDAAQQNFQLVAKSPGTPLGVVIDPDALREAGGKAFAVNSYTPSPSGKQVAAVLASGDGELGTLHLLDVASGGEVSARIEGIWGQEQPQWSDDGRSLYYVRSEGGRTGQGGIFGRMRVYERRLSDKSQAAVGDAPEGEADRLVAGWQVQGSPEMSATDWPVLELRPASRWAVLYLQDGFSAGMRAHLIPAAKLGRAGGTWQPLFDESAAVRDAVLHGDTVYALSWRDAPRYKVLAYDLKNLEEPPITVLSQQDGVIEQMAAAEDGLYVVVRNGALSELKRVPHKRGKVETLALPYPGAVQLLASHAKRNGLVFALQSWTRAPQVFASAGKPGGDKVANTGLKPAPTLRDSDDWVSEESTCTSHDGVQVPLSLIYRKGTPKDGNRPTLLDGYGGYGMADPATFMPRLGAWYERGGVYAQVSPRGGGAFGRDWYQAGRGPTKANTWKDMIACAKALVERGWTRPERLAIEGRSMGGVAAGRALTERPELFAAGIIGVGVTDPLRIIEASDNGPNHLTELGDPKTAEGVAQLQAMSTYAQVQPNVRYPAMLFTTGMNDKRVAPWQAFKTAARMQAVSAALPAGRGRPVLLRVDADGGHGATAEAAQRNAELADRLGFALSVLGDPAFQP